MADAQVPVDELRDLIGEWDDVRAEFLDVAKENGGLGFNDGVAEGARSAAQDLNGLIERHEGADR